MESFAADFSRNRLFQKDQGSMCGPDTPSTTAAMLSIDSASIIGGLEKKLLNEKPMTLPAKTQAQWQADPLLSGQTPNPNFVRTHWDESKERTFGSWQAVSGPKSADHSPMPTTEPSITKDSGQNEAPGIDIHCAQGPASPASNISETNDINGASSPQVNSNAVHVVVTQSVCTQADDQQIKIARQQGYVQGLKDGMTKTLLDLQGERQKESDLIQQITAELTTLQRDSFRLFEPMRKLALHIAEELVRGELTLSGKAIERLIKACLADLNLQENLITLSANPSDLERVRPLLKAAGNELLLQADQTLLSGSIRLRANDTMIEDLIESRLRSLAQQLIDQPENWLKSSSSLVGMRVESVDVKSTEMNENSTFDEVAWIDAEPVSTATATATAEPSQEHTPEELGEDEKTPVDLSSNSVSKFQTN